MAIKHISDVFKSEISARAAIREVAIQKRLSALQKGERFVPQLKNVKLVEFKDGRADVYLIMSYGGSPLSTFMKRHRHEYTEQTVITIYYNLLRSLAYIHSAGIMHRDLKPENVLVGKDLSVMICDFGIARSELSCHNPSMKGLQVQRNEPS